MDGEIEDVLCLTFNVELKDTNSGILWANSLWECGFESAREEHCAREERGGIKVVSSGVAKDISVHRLHIFVCVKVKVKVGRNK